MLPCLVTLTLQHRRRSSALPPNGHVSLSLLSLPPYFNTSSRRSCSLTRKRHPLFSIACTLFSTRNSAHPFYFLSPAHSLPKTPGGGGSTGLSKQSICFPAHLTTIESICFPPIRSNPFRILLFRNTEGGAPPCFKLRGLSAGTHHREPAKFRSSAAAPFLRRPRESALPPPRTGVNCAP